MGKEEWHVHCIVNAYESGVGHGFDNYKNPYKEGSPEALAYELGKAFGKKRGINAPKVQETPNAPD